MHRTLYKVYGIRFDIMINGQVQLLYEQILVHESGNTLEVNVCYSFAGWEI